MLTIQWIVTRGKAKGLVEQTGFAKDSLPAAMAHAKAMLGEMRKRHRKRPPNGSRILDADGKEIGYHIIISEPFDT